MLTENGSPGSPGSPGVHHSDGTIFRAYMTLCAAMFIWGVMYIPTKTEHPKHDGRGRLNPTKTEHPKHDGRHDILDVIANR